MKPAARPALQLRRSPRGARPSATTLVPPAAAAAVPPLAHREAGTADGLFLLAVLSLALLLILTALLPAPAAGGRSPFRTADARSTIGGVGVSLLFAAGFLFLLIELTAQ